MLLESSRTTRLPRVVRQLPCSYMVVERSHRHNFMTDGDAKRVCVARVRPLPNRATAALATLSPAPAGRSAGATSFFIACFIGIRASEFFLPIRTTACDANCGVCRLCQPFDSSNAGPSVGHQRTGDSPQTSGPPSEAFQLKIVGDHFFVGKPAVLAAHQRCPRVLREAVGGIHRLQRSVLGRASSRNC